MVDGVRADDEATLPAPAPAPAPTPAPTPPPVAAVDTLLAVRTRRRRRAARALAGRCFLCLALAVDQYQPCRQCQQVMVAAVMVCDSGPVSGFGCA